jgi:putative protease
MFVHGAMCMAVSGRCLLSAHLCGHSGSKGDCKHSCRWEWQLVEQKRPGETMPVFETGRSTLFMGSTDLCLLRQIPLLMDSGIRSLKVEGRMKSEYYVATVARVYRAAIDAYAENPHGFTVQQEWLDELEAVSHRPYEEGFAFGYPLDRPESLQTHNRPVSTHEVVALVTGVRDGRYALEVKNSFLEGDELEWIAPGMASGTVRVEAIAKADGKATQRGHCGSDALVTLGEGALLPEHAILRRRTAS